MYDDIVACAENYGMSPAQWIEHVVEHEAMIMKPYEPEEVQLPWHPDDDDGYYGRSEYL
ncbi:hypothetical protein TOK_0474 [Pseudonocardia sp. N23]|nr:hypothetical protein TOK_0474 [Pseudonocardia sp. N23]